MSSLPLISHRLFVAAAKSGGWVTSQRDPASQGRLAKTQEPALRAPLEIVDFGRPLPLDYSSPGEIFALKRDRRPGLAGRAAPG